MLIISLGLAYMPFSNASIKTAAPHMFRNGMLYTRGLNLFGPWQQLYGGADVFASPEQLDYYKSRGFTVFRQPLLWEALQPTRFGPLNLAYLWKMDSFVARLKTRHMRVSLSFINQGVYPAASHHVISGFDLADIWKKLAQHYKNEPTVWAYDLMNEPFNDQNWLKHAQMVINRIRAIDKHKPIIVTPQQEDSSGYIHFGGFHDPDHNLWYEAHTYFDSNASGAYHGSYVQEGAYPMIGVDRARPFVQWCWQHAFVQGQMHCIEGEYGVPGGWMSGGQHTTYGKPATDHRWLIVLDNFLTYLDQNHISGTYWEAGPYGDRASVEPDNLGRDRPQMTILTRHPGSSS